MTDTCKTCRFYHHLLKDDNGECRIRPVPAKTFPRRNENKGCGEHQPKERQLHNIDCPAPSAPGPATSKEGRAHE